ncbi:MAG: type II toxin-antitoxin system VapC family toxin [Bifidobacteriaceae bacterium]|jgi:predicted nucleic acid-binding protein|nr:type II toxin-antitoxin system VapC family toxin [Bifidobacteriaceae bacterium]
MILLDTNVVSEPMKLGGGDPLVSGWLNAQAPGTLCLSTITVAELLYGVAILPAGIRRERLHRRLTVEVLPVFSDRIFGFDYAAAATNSELRARAKARGRPIPDSDGFIAAIALSRGFALATRNTRHFEGVGLELINPWLGRSDIPA